MRLPLLCFLVLLYSVAGFQRIATNTALCGKTLSSGVANPGWEVRSYHGKKAQLPPLHASETSFNMGETGASATGRLRGALGRNLAILGNTLRLTTSATTEVALSYLRRTWWILPMSLALFPLCCAFFKGTCAAMPHWWQVVKLDNILKSKDAALVIWCFLLSNISYFISGLYLLTRFPFERTKHLMRYRPTKFSMLGVWVLLAGLVSTVFHSVQALGTYSVAESLCYIDHGVAISAAFYYFDTCGFPSRLVLAIGLMGIAALVVTYPSYAWLHSSWHLLSAAAATRWAVEGHQRTSKKNG